MKSKWLILTKVQLLGLLGFNRARHTEDPAARRKARGAAVLLAVAAVVIAFYVVMVAVLFCSQGLGRNLPALCVALVSMITLLFTLLRGSAGLFAMKDYDQVMSLPVTKRDLLLSRLLCSYLANLAFSLGVTVPCLIVFFVMEGFSLAVLAVSLAGAVFAPLAPMAAASVIATLLTALTARFRYKNLLQTAVQMVLFIGLMALSFSLSFSNASGEQADMSALFNVLVCKIYPPALLIGMTLSGQIWAIFVFIGGSAAIAAAFVAVLSLCYVRVHDALCAKAASVAYDSKHVRGGSARAALVRREFKRLTSSPVYLMNGVAGVLLLIIAAIALLVFDVKGKLLAAGLSEEMLASFLYGGAGLLFMFLCMSCPSASALSLEGSSRDQLFALPVSPRTVLLAKTVPTLCIDTAAGLIAACALCARLGADAAAWIVLPLSMPVFAAFTALSGIFLNYKFPKYDWTTEAQAVKQSAPVMIMSFGCMALGFGAAAAGFFFGVWAVVALDALCLALCIAVFAYLRRAKLYV